MNILVIDDEALALKMTAGAVKEAVPEAEVHSFTKPSEFLEYAKNNPCDVAFLDINMRGITGIELAKKLKAISPRINIIFATGYDQYKSEAMDLHASGYILKPVVSENVKEELKYLRYPVEEGKKVKIRCFGNFTVTVQGQPVHFSYDRTNELLAYLVDRKGAMVNYGELSAILWEDDSHIHYLKKLRSDLLATFEALGIPELVIAQKGKLGIDMTQADCDYMDYLSGKPKGLNAFRGEYMQQYSWAEETLGALLMD